ncbi:hypothetical protein [Ferruginibacter sp.]
MTHTEFFKLQAKNLFRDFQTKKKSPDAAIGDYEYDPKYFDIEGVILYFDIDEENFSLMNAQHIIADMVGFNKWTELIKASEPELELAKLLFDNQDSVSLDDWKMYIISMERENNTTLHPETKLEIFQQVFLDGGYERLVVSDNFRL